jgi:hypothetical protein
MTQHQLPAALSAPLRVVQYENRAGRATFECDRSLSLFCTVRRGTRDQQSRANWIPVLERVLAKRPAEQEDIHG